jgi:hypothetical protein
MDEEKLDKIEMRVVESFIYDMYGFFGAYSGLIDNFGEEDIYKIFYGDIEVLPGIAPLLTGCTTLEDLSRVVAYRLKNTEADVFDVLEAAFGYEDSYENPLMENTLEMSSEESRKSYFNSSSGAFWAIAIMYSEIDKEKYNERYKRMMNMAVTLSNCVYER